MNVTRHDLCLRIKKKVRSTVNMEDIKTILETFSDEVVDILARNHSIELRGFGTFEVKRQAKRIGRNPKTGYEFPVPERNAPKFRFTREAIKIFHKIQSAEEQRLLRAEEIRKKELKKGLRKPRIKIPNIEVPVDMTSEIKSDEPPPIIPEQLPEIILSPDPVPVEPPPVQTLSDIVSSMTKNQGPKQGLIEREPPKPDPVLSETFLPA